MKRGLVLGALLLLLAAACRDGASGGEPTGRGAAQPPRPSASPERVLRIGKIPYLSSRGLLRKYEPLLARLAPALGVDRVELVLAPDYGAVLGNLRAGRVEIAWLGTVTYLHERSLGDLAPLVRPRWEGQGWYRGAIVTRADSGIDGLPKLAGRSVAFVEPGSASGYLFPAALLRKAGVDPERDLVRRDFLGSHDNVLMAVFLGRFDAGAVYESTWRSLDDPERVKQLRVLATTENIPNEPLVCTSAVPPELRARWQRAFLELSVTEAADGAVLELIEGLTGFEATVAADYDAAAKMLGL